MCIPSSTNPKTTFDSAHCALRHLFEYVTDRALVRWGANGSVKSVDETVDWSVDKSSVRSEDDKSTDGQIISILLTNPHRNVKGGRVKSSGESRVKSRVKSVWINVMVNDWCVLVVSAVT